MTSSRYVGVLEIGEDGYEWKWWQLLTEAPVRKRTSNGASDDCVLPGPSIFIMTAAECQGLSAFSQFG